jgi:integrase/recombinase XerD
VNTLRAAASDYLTLRRALGFKLYDAGLLLEQFIDFLQANHADTITTALAVHWATEPRGVRPAWHARRLAVVRGFARWRQATDPVTEVPPNGLLPAHTRRATPYLYSGQEIAALMAAAARLPSPLRAATMQAFIGLVFATGIRRGEALGLDDGDLDPAAGMLTVRRAKLDKTRRLPLHRSTMAALVDYQHRRDRLFPNLGRAVRLHHRRPAVRNHGVEHVRGLAAPSRHPTAHARAAPTYPRRPPHFRREHPARVVPRRR